MSKKIEDTLNGFFYTMFICIIINPVLKDILFVAFLYLIGISIVHLAFYIVEKRKEVSYEK